MREIREINVRYQNPIRKHLEDADKTCSSEGKWKTISKKPFLAGGGRRDVDSERIKSTWSLTESESLRVL